MVRSGFLVVVATILSPTHGYSVNHRHNRASRTTLMMTTQPSSSRRQWCNEIMGLVTATSTIGSLWNVPPAFADDGNDGGAVVPTTPLTDTTKPTYTIEKCSTSSTRACVSTANVRNLDLYAPPWTFEQSPEEAMARLKGAIVADPGCTIVDQDGSQYLAVDAERNDLFGSIDRIIFIINDKDRVVFFRSSTMNNENKDFGFNKKRLGEIRKRAGIFGVMGESMMTADIATDSQRGNGPLGQLKAFYGLQSGGGFEDVVLE